MRVIVIGAGVRGREWAKAARAHRSFAPIQTCDPDASTQPTWASFADAAAASSSGQLGALAIVASPPHLHAEHAIAALESGCAVLVEKPLALSVHDAAAVVGASAATQLPVIVAQNYRFKAPNRAAARSIKEGLIGTPRRSVVTSTRPHHAVPPIDAMTVAEATLWDIGVHHLDLLISQFGGRPNDVRASVTEDSPLGPSWTVELAWDGGARALYRHALGPEIFQYRQWIEGDAGALDIDADRALLVRAGARPKELRASTSPKATPEHLLLDEVLRVRGGEPSLLTAEHNVHVVSTIVAALEAAMRG